MNAETQIGMRKFVSYSASLHLPIQHLQYSLVHCKWAPSDPSLYVDFGMSSYLSRIRDCQVLTSQIEGSFAQDPSREGDRSRWIGLSREMPLLPFRLHYREVSGGFSQSRFRFGTDSVLIEMTANKNDSSNVRGLNVVSSVVDSAKR